MAFCDDDEGCTLVNLGVIIIWSIVLPGEWRPCVSAVVSVVWCWGFELKCGCAQTKEMRLKKNQACPNDRSDVAEVEAKTATFCGLQVRKVIPDVLFEAWMKRLECKYTTVKWRLPWATTKQRWQRQGGAFCTSSDYSFPPKLVSFVLFVFPVFILCYTWKKKSHNERLTGNNCR